MSSFRCPDCGSTDLGDYWESCLECFDCGYIFYEDDCTGFTKINKKQSFDDEEIKKPRKKKISHREKSPKINVDNFEVFHED